MTTFNTTGKLLAGTALCLLLLIIRVVETGQLTYAFLIWNLWLAWIPFLIARFMNRNHHRRWSFIILTGAWLITFPNAPYLITDLKHLGELGGVPSWFDAVLLFCSALNGMILGFESVNLMISACKKQSNLPHRYLKLITGIIIPPLFFITSFGVYLGRMLRFNSWDAIIHPGRLAIAVGSRVFNPIDNLDTWKFTAIYALGLFVAYQLWFKRAEAVEPTAS